MSETEEGTEETATLFQIDSHIDDDVDVGRQGAWRARTLHLLVDENGEGPPTAEVFGRDENKLGEFKIEPDGIERLDRLNDESHSPIETESGRELDARTPINDGEGLLAKEDTPVLGDLLEEVFSEEQKQEITRHMNGAEEEAEVRRVKQLEKSVDWEPRDRPGPRPMQPPAEPVAVGSEVEERATLHTPHHVDPDEVRREVHGDRVDEDRAKAVREAVENVDLEEHSVDPEDVDILTDEKTREEMRETVRELMDEVDDTPIVVPEVTEEGEGEGEDSERDVQSVTDLKPDEQDEDNQEERDGTDAHEF